MQGQTEEKRWDMSLADQVKAANWEEVERMLDSGVRSSDVLSSPTGRCHPPMAKNAFLGVLFAGKTEIALRMLEIIPPEALQGSAGTKALQQSICLQQRPVSDRLLDMMDGEDIGRPGAGGKNAAHFAAAAGDVNLLSRLLSLAPDAAVTPSSMRDYPVASALGAPTNSKDVLDLLMEHTPRNLLLVENLLGLTVLHVAAQRCNVYAIDRLLDVVPELANSRTYPGGSPAHCLVRCDDPPASIVERLLSYTDKDLLLTTPLGEPLLHLAVTGGRVDVIKVVLQAVSPEALALADGGGRTPAEVAAGPFKDDILRILAPRPKRARCSP